MFDNIDFKSGTVTWQCESLEEDMLMIEFPNEIYLNAGFTNKFYVDIIRDRNFNFPDSVYIAENTYEFLFILPFAIERADSLSKVNKPYYGTLWKTKYFYFNDLKGE